MQTLILRKVILSSLLYLSNADETNEAFEPDDGSIVELAPLEVNLMHWP